MTSRHSAVAGAIFALGFLGGQFVIDAPDDTASNATFSAFYDSAGNRGQMLAGCALVIVAGIGWLLFTVGLRERTGDGSAGRVIGAAGTATATLLLVSAALIAYVPLDVTFSSGPAPAVALQRAFPTVGYAVLVLGAMPMVSVALVALAVAALQRHSLPRGLAWSAVVVAVALLLSAAWFPMFTLVIWVVAAAVVLARRPLRIPLPD